MVGGDDSDDANEPRDVVLNAESLASNYRQSNVDYFYVFLFFPLCSDRLSPAVFPWPEQQQQQYHRRREPRGRRRQRLRRRHRLLVRRGRQRRCDELATGAGVRFSFDMCRAFGSIKWHDLYCHFNFLIVCPFKQTYANM